MTKRIIVGLSQVLNRFIVAFLTLFVIMSNFANFSIVQAEEEDNELQEIAGRRDEYSTTYLNQDGTYTVYFYTQPVRYRDEKGKLKDIDTSIKVLANKEKEELATDYSYKSSSTAVDVFLPEEVSSENPVLLTWDKYSVSLSPITSGSAEDAVNNKEEELTLVRLEVAIKKAYLR